ncbi:minor tail protein [Propionibacterium phage G4]|uniref:Minor tail protein n=1 Tax=Propionibacterium phage G4 TaxID=1897537 RepID=A0A1D8EU72_9CAUD|nr:tail protein [Propionibacterium phage G4]AOT24607.1 minor tail protein [Propionibacterium phage G4]
MIEVSKRWASSVGAGARWSVMVSWSSDGGQAWHDVVPTACSVDESTGQQVRWKLSCTLRKADAEGLTVFGCRARVFVSMHHTDSWEETIQLGEFRIDTTSDTTLAGPSGAQVAAVQVSGSSWEQQLMDSRLVEPREVSGAAIDVLGGLIREVLPDAEIVFDGGIDPGRNIPATVVERDRWAFIDGSNSSETSVARMLGAQVSTDARGVWHVAPPPVLDGTAAWTIEAGKGGALLSAVASEDRSTIRNAVVARGESTDKSVPVLGPVTVADHNAWSPTNVDTPVSRGGFGTVPLFYTSSLFTDLSQVEAAAKAMLQPRLGVKRTMDLTTLFDPAKRAGDVGVVQTTDGPVTVVLESVSCDLVGASMTCQTRGTTGTELITTETTTKGETIA